MLAQPRDAPNIPVSELQKLAPIETRQESPYAKV